MTLFWALVWNAGTCRFAAKGEVQVGGPYKGESTDTEHGGGAAGSRAAGSVMGSDRRGCIVWRDSRANQQWEELYG